MYFDVGCITVSMELREIIERERISYPDKEKLFMVLGLFLSGRISMGKAAELLGLRIDDFMLLMYELGVRYTIIDEVELDEELNAFKKLFKSRI